MVTGMWIRLKLMAPLHRPRTPRPRDFAPSCDASPFDLAFLGMGALRLHQGRLTGNRGTPDLLIQRWPVNLDLRHRHGLPSAALDGTMNGFDDGHVDQAFFPR